MIWSFDASPATARRSQSRQARASSSNPAFSSAKSVNVASRIQP
jgi:hypothetical protein